MSLINKMIYSPTRLYACKVFNAFFRYPFIAGATAAVGATFATLLWYGVAGFMDKSPASVSFNNNLTTAIVEDGYIKVPFDVDRTKDCLTSSTMVLTRPHEYAQPYGERQDIVSIGLYNTNITDKGYSKIMLWFPIPRHIPGGVWQYEAHIQDDCGNLLDFKNNPSRPVHPREIIIPDNINTGG